MLKRHLSPVDPAGAVPSWWPPLLQVASPHASIYLSASWMQTWLEIYGRHFQADWLHWEIDGKVVAGCLLVRGPVRRFAIPFRTLFLNASGETAERVPFMEYNSIACVAGHEDAVGADLLRFLEAQPWDAIHLSGYERGGVMGRLAEDLPAAFVHRDPQPCPYVDLPGLASAALEPTLSPGARARLRRCRSLYVAQHGPLQLAAASSAEEALEWFARLTVLHTQRWRSKGQPGSFGTEAGREFHRRLIRRLWRDRQVDLLRLRAGDQEVGYLYNFLEDGKVSVYQSGFVYGRDAKMKPGLLTHALAIEHYARAGLREYDFLSGDARYKRTLARGERTLHWTVVYRNSAWVHLLVWPWKLRARLPGARGAGV